ncbi:conserved hypothetical protein [Ricinus communis]|uniref:Uncharacterized protein n=1 Tax=Ricinus communis TaxID=3988 RepID=B9T8X2_RICCO|nr:conserved hypothetical protein [Ricinus communis]
MLHPGLQFGDFFIKLAGIRHQRVQQHLVLLARPGVHDLDLAGGDRAALGHLDDHFVGHDLAVAGLPDHHARTGDDAALGARQRHFAALGLQHGARCHAAHADGAIGIGDRAPHQVFAEHHIAAARHDIAEHVAVDRDVAAFDHALLLHVAELLVLAGQLQVAGGARADALAADDLGADRQALGRRIHAQKALHRRHQELAAAQALDDRALAGHRG